MGGGENGLRPLTGSWKALFWGVVKMGLGVGFFTFPPSSESEKAHTPTTPKGENHLSLSRTDNDDFRKPIFTHPPKKSLKARFHSPPKKFLFPQFLFPHLYSLTLIPSPLGLFPHTLFPHFFLALSLPALPPSKSQAPKAANTPKRVMPCPKRL